MSLILRDAAKAPLLRMRGYRQHVWQSACATRYSVLRTRHHMRKANEEPSDTSQDRQSPAPVAPRRPHSFTTHGITVIDDYAWLKDAKWQEVLRDPSVLEPDIRNYLEAENDYTESLLGHTAGLQKTLVAEMRGRIKEDDSSVPSPDGPFAYLRKFREGGQHEMFGRMPRGGGDAAIILDGDELAANHKYFRFGGARHSPDHKLQAWSADIKGSEYFSVRVRDWDRRQRPRRPGRGDRRHGGVERGQPKLLLRQARRQPPPDAGLAASARHAAGGRCSGLRGKGFRLVHPYPRELQRPVLRDRRRRPRDIRAPAGRSGRSLGAAAAGRGARGRRAIFGRRPRRRTVHSHQCRRRHRLQGRHRAAGKRRSAPTGAT